MNHVGTICTHCSNGCKTTLGVRNDQIIRGNNRDRSGINGEFLCIKGRYAFDFTDAPERLQSPMMRVDGKLQPVSWSRALLTVAKKFNEIRERGGKFGVIGSNHTTNEENFYLQQFARNVLGHQQYRPSSHRRSADAVRCAQRKDQRAGDDGGSVYGEGRCRHRRGPRATASADRVPASVELSASWGRIYTVTEGPVRERKYATASIIAAPERQLAELEGLREQLAAEPELVILFGDTIKGDAVRQLVAFGDSLGIPVKYVCLVDFSNSRGASDMGLLPASPRAITACRERLE